MRRKRIVSVQTNTPCILIVTKKVQSGSAQFWVKDFMELTMKKILIASIMAFGMTLSVQAKDIVDTAVSAGSFKTLATALGAAGLVDTLKGKGPLLFSHQLTKPLQRFQKPTWKLF